MKRLWTVKEEKGSLVLYNDKTYVCTLGSAEVPFYQFLYDLFHFSDQIANAELAFVIKEASDWLHNKQQEAYEREQVKILEFKRALAQAFEN